MRRVKLIGVTAALSAGFVATMVTATPMAFATTPAAAPTTAAPSTAATTMAGIGVVRSDDTPYEDGYRDGYQDGFSDGREACDNFGARSKPKLNDHEQGYVDGYNAGFSKAQDQCGHND